MTRPFLNKVFRAHGLIVSRASTVLATRVKDLQEEQSEKGSATVVEVKNVHPEVFSNCLEFMYTGSCDLLRHPCPENFTISGLAEEEQTVNDNQQRHLVTVNGNNPSAYAVAKQNKRNSGGVQGKKGASKSVKKSHVNMVKEAATDLGLTTMVRAINNVTNGGSFRSFRQVGVSNLILFVFYFTVTKQHLGNHFLAKFFILFHVVGFHLFCSDYN